MMINPSVSAELSDLTEQEHQELKNTARELKDEIEKWKHDADDLAQHFWDVGTEVLYLHSWQYYAKTDKKGKYHRMAKNVMEKETKRLTQKISSLREKKKQLEKEKESLKKDSGDSKTHRKEEDIVKDMANKDMEIASAIKEKGSLNKKKSSLLEKTRNLLNVIKKIIPPLQERAPREIDLTPQNNPNMNSDVRLLDVCRVLQSYNRIADERLWFTTRFKVKFGGRNVVFTLSKARHGYNHVYYNNPIAEEQYGLRKNYLSYENDIWRKLGEINGNSPHETRHKQVKVAEFMLQNLRTKIENQPMYASLINDPTIPIPELGNDVRLKRVIEDFVLLTHISESSSLSQKQLNYWKEKIEQESNMELDMSEEIDELKSNEASWEDYHSNGRTLALDTIARDYLENFISGNLQNFMFLKEAFSEAMYPAQKLGGTKESKQWAADNQQKILLSSVEFAPLEEPPISLSSVTPDLDEPSTSQSSSTPDLAQMTASITGGLQNSDNVNIPLNSEARDVEENNQKGIKRLNSESDKTFASKEPRRAFDSDSDSNPCDIKRQSVCQLKGKKIKVDENSVKLKSGFLSFDVYEAHNKENRYTAKIKFDPENLSSLKYGGEQEKYARDTRRGKVNKRIGTAFGIHGTIMGIFGAISSFQREDSDRGTVSTIQALHGIGSLTKINQMVEKLSEKVLLHAISRGSAKLGLSSIARKASSQLLKLAEKSSERLLGDIPYVGLAFDAYFIAEDLKDLQTAVKEGSTEEIALDTVHLILDTQMVVANLVVDVLGSEFEPVVWALSLIRMAIDDFYYDIAAELKKAHGTGEKILAFFKGLGEGLIDFLTGGLLRGLKQLREQKERDRELLNKFANPRLYFNISSDCKTIDFTSGQFSSYGGGLNFKLNNNDSFTVSISDVPDEKGFYSTKTKTFSCHGLTDIVLGIGQSQSLEWKTKEAKLWGVIPVASASVIDKFKDDKNSLYGSYRGNKENNTFIAYQGNFSKVLKDECKDPDATGVIDMRLKNYFYILNGMAGNDSFFLGPQRAHVSGGEGHDLYYMGTHGGNTVIDNFAYDKLSDTLWLNVSHRHVICGRKDYDLLVQYCGTHMLMIKNWFYAVTHDFRRHLVIITRDGVQLKIKDMGILKNNYMVDCVPVSIDLSKSGKSQYLDLRKPPYTEVVTVTGSTKSDTILGNHESNFINAGPGSNIIRGGEGEDTYMIKAKGGCDHVNNFAKDEMQDKIFIPFKYSEIEIMASSTSDMNMPSILTKKKPKNFEMRCLNLKLSRSRKATESGSGIGKLALFFPFIFLWEYMAISNSKEMEFEKTNLQILNYVF